MSSFVRRGGSGSASGSGRILPPAKAGPNGTMLVSTGVGDLDKILGGGIPVGRLLLVMEDAEAPHHFLLLRYFMAQAVSHAQPLLFGSSLASPRAFLGTLPAIIKSESINNSSTPEQEGLRIAWQYRKYDAAAPAAAASGGDEYISSFDMRKACDGATLNSTSVECFSLQDGTTTLDSLVEKCSRFVSALSSTTTRLVVGRIALHSLCAPQSMESFTEWEMLSFLLHLKALVHNANAVAIVTLPAALVSCPQRWQHLADVLLSITALPDEEQGSVVNDKDITGLLQVHKLPSINTQVPTIPTSTTYAIKIHRKKEVMLEPLHLAPVEAAACDSSCPSGI